MYELPVALTARSYHKNAQGHPVPQLKLQMCELTTDEVG